MNDRTKPTHERMAVALREMNQVITEQRTILDTKPTGWYERFMQLQDQFLVAMRSCK